MKKKFRIIFRCLFLLFLVLGTVYILVRRPSDTVQTATGPIFGTTYHITYTYAEPIDTFIVREMQAVDHSLSMFNPQSTTSRLNRGETDRTDGLVEEMWQLSEHIASATDGAFDPTVAPLVNAWGFGFKHNALPDSADVDSLLRLVGHDKVKLSGGRLTKKAEGLMLDFSAVAKGYGVDRVARLLDSRGVKHYMVEIGGEVVVKGGHPEGRPWKVGVTTPEDGGNGSVQCMFELTDGAMATSGNYLRHYERNGRRYAHTIDPRTGYPVQHEVLSATVFAPDCATADAYATAFMVLGLEKAKAVLARHKELKAYLICSAPNGQYRIWHSPDLKPLKP